MWRWTGSDLQHGWICDMRNLEVEQIYVPRLASPYCPVFQHQPAKKMWNFPDTYFIFYYPAAKLRIMSHVTAVARAATVTLRRRTRSSLTSRFVLIPTERSTGSRLTIDDGKDEGREEKGRGASSPGSAQPTAWTLTFDLWIIIPALRHPASQNQNLKPGSMEGWRDLFFKIFFFIGTSLRVTDSQSYRPDSRHLTTIAAVFTGLPASFYCAFWDLLQTALRNSHITVSMLCTSIFHPFFILRAFNQMQREALCDITTDQQSISFSRKLKTHQAGCEKRVQCDLLWRVVG